MRPDQKLEAWSKAIELVTDIYRSSEKKLANRLGCLDETTFASLISQLERIGRLITGLVRHLSASPRGFTKTK